MLLVAFLHTLEAIVQTIFFVIFEIGLGNRVSACQIDLGCRDCTASVLFQRVRIVCGSEFEVIALIVLSIGFGIAEGLSGFVDTVAACISIMRSFTVAGAVEGCVIQTFFLGRVACQNSTGDIIGSRIIDRVQNVERTADMAVNCIPFFCPVNIIIAAASDIADAFNVFPILENSHQTGHVAFYAAFIQDISIGKPVVRERCIFIGDHNCDRTLICEIAADPFAGQVTFYHAFFRRNILLNGFCFRLRFCFSRSGSAFLHLSYRNGFYGVIFASAAEQHGCACQTGQQKYSQFLHFGSSLSYKSSNAGNGNPYTGYPTACAKKCEASLRHTTVTIIA